MERVEESGKVEQWLNQLKDVSDFVLITVLKARADEKVRQTWQEEEQEAPIPEETIKPTKAVEGVSVHNIGEPKQFTVNCSVCGIRTTVPFRPNDKWPVYCRECYDKKKGRK